MAPSICFKARERKGDLVLTVVGCTVSTHHLLSSPHFANLPPLFLPYLPFLQNLPDMDGAGNKTDAYVKVGRELWERRKRDA